MMAASQPASLETLPESAPVDHCHTFSLFRLHSMCTLPQDVSRHSRAADVAAFVASQPAAAASIRRIAVQSLGRCDAASGSHSTGVASPPAEIGGRSCASGAAEQGADACAYGAAQAAGVLRAVHALKCTTRRSRCAAMITVPAGALFSHDAKSDLRCARANRT